MNANLAALVVYRDAVLEGHPETAALLEEVNDSLPPTPRFRGRLTMNGRPVRYFGPRDEDDYEDEPEPPETDESWALRMAAWRRSQLRRDWSAWPRLAGSLDFSSFDSMLRDMYPADAVPALADRTRPLLNLMDVLRRPYAREPSVFPMSPSAYSLLQEHVAKLAGSVVRPSKATRRMMRTRIGMR